ncbi:NUDIX domain-containing protein [Paraferrimonas sp. SM1919]|uniref:NUDIX domain-containing protein n=1 Tax=Paraferrimonas sp. SM1919 TaxID=2662263 RepID=UPI0013D67625|nr:NUDIX domain-containing protein [Paraferrimonas sp. SM1919]
MRKGSRLKQRIPKYNLRDVEIINKESCYQGFFQLDRYTLRHKRFDNTDSDIIHREIFERGDAVAVLAYDPKRDEVVLVEQFRAAARQHPSSPWLIEVVAGMLDKDLSIEQTATLELFEETGLRANKLMFINSFMTSPGGCSERISLYLALVDATTAAISGGVDDEHEDILVHTMPRQQAWQWLEAGEIDNAVTIIALQWLQLNYLNLGDDEK